MLPRCIAMRSLMHLRRSWSKPVSRIRLQEWMVRSWGPFGVKAGRGGPVLTPCPCRCGRPLLPLASLMRVECLLVPSGVSVAVVSGTAVLVLWSSLAPRVIQDRAMA